MGDGISDFGFHFRRGRGARGLVDWLQVAYPLSHAGRSSDVGRGSFLVLGGARRSEIFLPPGRRGEGRPGGRGGGGG
jgi:hypothetical protein